jgi:KamA family protein
MITPRKMKFYGLRDIDNIPQLQSLSSEQKFELKVVSHVLPFRVNNYVVENLIDWDNIPADPIYQLTFMQRGMLTENQFQRMADALLNKKTNDEITKVANKIRLELNPHPAGQMTLNVPKIDDEPIPGIQHKYRETVLIFPSSGQTCHSYCTFCLEESSKFKRYLARNKDVTDVLLTGGDPMVMSAKNLSAYIETLLTPELEHIRNIRIGTKSVAYWPYKFVTDKDADDILKLFEKVNKAGKHLAIMGHYNHWQELTTEVAQAAIQRIKSTGAQIRTQSPLVKHVNDDPAVWARLWKDQVKYGAIPYYFFVERNTGAEKHFAIPLYRTYEIYREAYKQVSGLHRTVRGPSMSAFPGKVSVDGVTQINGEKVFMLNLLQARNPDWVKRPFFAKYSTTATWLNDLEPAFGEDKFFFQDELDELIHSKHGQKFFDSKIEDTELVDASLNADD